MPTPKNKKLYNLVKLEADQKYNKPSAYKSGYIVKQYKNLGGEYINDDKPKNLKRWFQEEWKDVGHSAYPVYRPTKRMNAATPLLVSEISKKNLTEQISLKQLLKGDHNQPKFIPKK